ncbi:MAG: T9SS type A sorting domain-containing protein [Ignavibacteriales bacterium]|nr:T9SS type A sorting domain-containing protein [Ignavibacteriales bacterium]
MKRLIYLFSFVLAAGVAFGQTQVLDITFEEGELPVVNNVDTAGTTITLHNDTLYYADDAPAAGTYSAQFPDTATVFNTPAYLTVEGPNFDSTAFTLSMWVKFEHKIRDFTRFVILPFNTEAAGQLHYNQSFYIRTNGNGQLRAQYVSGTGVSVTLDTRENLIELDKWYRVIFEVQPDAAIFEVRNENDEMLTKVFNNTDVTANPMRLSEVDKLYLGYALNEWEGTARHFSGEMDNVEYYLGNALALDTIAPPVIASSPILTALEGEEVSYIASYTHQNGLSATISFESLPAWLTQSGDTLTGTAPTTGMTQTGTFKVVADDGTLADTLHVMWTVAVPETLYASPTGTAGGDGSEGNPYDLATAVAEAELGATIILLPGTYSITDEIVTDEAVHQKVTLVAQENALSTIIDGGNSANKFMEVRSGMTIDGLTFANFAGGDWYSENILMFMTGIDSTKPVTITNCVFDANATRQIYGYNGNTSRLLVYNNIFKNNTERAFASVFREIKVYNNTFFMNTPGIPVINAWSYDQAEIRTHLFNNIFSDNTAGGQLVQLFAEQSGRHTALWGGYNLFSDNTTNLILNDPKHGTAFTDTSYGGNVHADPMFDDEILEYLALQPGSPAIGAGMEIAEIETGPSPDMGCLNDELLLVDAPNNPATPIEYELSQNFPNPFNPSTTIKFAVAEAGPVKIEVYNMLGQTVATLVDRDMTPGKYEINFANTNLASGVYIYRMEAGDFVNVKKMTLLK